MVQHYTWACLSPGCLYLYQVQCKTNTKKQTVSALSLKKKKKSKKESVPKRLSRCFPSLFSALFLLVRVFVMSVKQPSSRHPLRKNGYNFEASQNLFESKLSVCSCNIVATWPNYEILLVNNIPLYPPIVLIYQLVSDGTPFWYTKPHLSIVRNWLFFILLLKHTSLLSHYWKASQIVIYCSFNIYFLSSHLLGYNLFWLDLVGILGFFLKHYDCKSIIELFYT